MEINNVKLLDEDEPIRDIREKNVKDIVDFCRKYDLTLDLASSDVVIYIQDKFGGEIAIS